MTAAAFLIFPSRGPESLSRVLIEASALGVPTAAMDTGGKHGTSSSPIAPDSFPPMRAGWRATCAGSQRTNHCGGAAWRCGGAPRPQRFDAPRVVARIESIYEELVASRRSRA